MARFIIFGGAKCFSLPILAVLSYLVTSSAIAPHTKPVRTLFFIGHSKECNDDRNILQALETNAVFGSSFSEFERHFNDVLKIQRESRPVNVFNSTSFSNHPRRQLSEMSWLERRDQSIAALNALFALESREMQTETASISKSLESSNSVSVAFLERLGIDIIDDSLVPSSKLFELAKGLPCLQFAPERDLERFPTQFVPPNDYVPANQWYLDVAPKGVGAVSAWGCYNGQKDAPIVAVLDTGCSQDTTGKDNPYSEVQRQQHGTAVSSMIAAVANNGKDLAGVCWGCKIMCIKIANEDGTLPTSNILMGINFLLGTKVKISNHSYGGFGVLEAEKLAFQELEKAGHLVVTSAGNLGCDIGKPNSNEPTACKDKYQVPLDLLVPGGLDLTNMITVGATNEQAIQADFSCWGTPVHLFAPGDNVAVLQNTLFNPPLVAGAAAVLWGHDPSLTVAQLRNIIFTTVKKLPGLTGKCQTGGVLDLAAAMKKLSKRKPCKVPATQSIPSPNEDNTKKYYEGATCKEKQGSLAPKTLLNSFLFCAMAAIIVGH